MSRYINPYTDFGFKKLFGEKANKDLLIDFLNELLPEEHQIAELTFKNPEQLADLPEQRKAIFDIHCVAKSGEAFVVEMQKAKINYFKDRSLFYATFPTRDQAVRGDWDFRLNPVYFVVILDFEYDEAEERRKFLRSVQLKDQDGDLFYDKLHFKFIQMRLFHKESHELITHFDKWIYFLKNLSNFDEIPTILREPIFEKAFLTTELAAVTLQEREEYETSRLGYLEINAALGTAEEKGRVEGRVEGIQVGREAERNSIHSKIVQKLSKEGKSVAEIASFLEISIESGLKILEAHN